MLESARTPFSLLKVWTFGTTAKTYAGMQSSKHVGERENHRISSALIADSITVQPVRMVGSVATDASVISPARLEPSLKTATCHLSSGSLPCTSYHPTRRVSLHISWHVTSRSLRKPHGSSCIRYVPYTVRTMP